MGAPGWAPTGSEHRLSAIVRRSRPTVRGGWAGVAWVAVVITALASGQGTLWPLTAGLTTILVTAYLVSCRRSQRLPGDLSLYLRVTPPMVPVGAACRLHITVAGGARALPSLSLESPTGRWRQLDALPRAGRTDHSVPSPIGRWAPAGSSLVRFPALAAGSSFATSCTVPTGTRGIVGLPPLRLWTIDPLGLFGCAGPVQVSPAVVVHPLEVGIELFGQEPAVALGAEGASSGPPTIRTGSDSTGELLGLRPYRTGDRLLRIHWPSAAGTGPIMVREFAPDSDRVIQVVVDDRSGTHRRRAFDSALSTTCAIVGQATALGFAVDLLTLSGYRMRVEPTPEGMAALLPQLATLNPRREAEAPVGPMADWVRWDDSWSFGTCTVVTTETAVPSLPVAVTAHGRIVTV